MSLSKSSIKDPTMKECTGKGSCSHLESEPETSSCSCPHEKKELLSHTDEQHHTVKYWYRWYICFIFGLLGLLQSAVWNTWGPIDDSAEVALGFTADDIALLTNWGPITFLIAMPVYTWLLHSKGLRVSIVSAAFLVALGTGLRCLPVNVGTLRYFIHIGQILNGFSGCPAMAAPPLLSNVWFPPEERVTATAISTLISYCGAGFILGPMFVQNPSDAARNSSRYCLQKSEMSHNESCADVYKIRKEIDRLMYVEFAISTAMFLCVYTFFPEKPPSPPSISASSPRFSFKDGLLALRGKRQFWIVAMVSALVVGTGGGWVGILNLVLEPLGVSQTESSMIGFGTTLIGCAVGLFVGWFADRLKGRSKSILASLCIVSFVSFAYFVVLTNKWLTFFPFQPQKAEIWTVMTILSITMNAAVPVSMEMAADAAYPVGEETSTSVLTWLFNLLAFMFLLGLNVAPDPSFSNYVMLGCIMTSLPFVIFGIRDVNHRLQIDTSVTSNDGCQVARAAASYGSMDCNVNLNPDQRS